MDNVTTTTPTKPKRRFLRFSLRTFLLFIPWRTAWFRIALVFVFVGFHLSLAVFMSLGLFPLISICIWAVVLPGALWDRWLPALLDRSAMTTGEDRPLRTHPLAQGLVAVLLAYLVLRHAVDFGYVPFEQGKVYEF